MGVFEAIAGETKMETLLQWMLKRIILSYEDQDIRKILLVNFYSACYDMYAKMTHMIKFVQLSNFLSKTLRALKIFLLFLLV